ncbi:MAG: DNA repair protein RecO [Rickettsiales bacterium]|nr:DNA repair protein RecO [Rickettsiales bacterium]
MKFNDIGIIISQKKYGENSLVVKVFSQHHGIYRAFVKSVKSSKDKVNYQIGNLISFEYRSRIEENLGQFFAVDLIRSYCSKMMFDQLRLTCVNSLFSIIDSVFLERDNQQKLFEKLQNFLQKLSDDAITKKDFLADYIKLELKILKTLGYEIDLSCCAVSGVSENLTFVSPKSARAVCNEVGAPYKDKLLKLPNFLVSDHHHDENQLLDGLKLSGFFLEKFVFAEKSYNQSQLRFFHRDNIKNFLLKN